jgi:hypothetical protein
MTEGAAGNRLERQHAESLHREGEIDRLAACKPYAASAGALAALGLSPQTLIEALTRQNVLAPADAAEGAHDRVPVHRRWPRDAAVAAAVSIRSPVAWKTRLSHPGSGFGPPGWTTSMRTRARKEKRP